MLFKVLRLIILINFCLDNCYGGNFNVIKESDNLKEESVRSSLDNNLAQSIVPYRVPSISPTQKPNFGNKGINIASAEFFSSTPDEDPAFSIDEQSSKTFVFTCIPYESFTYCLISVEDSLIGEGFLCDIIPVENFVHDVTSNTSHIFSSASSEDLIHSSMSVAAPNP